MASDYVQDIVENQPDEKHNCNPTSDHLENPEGINAVGITPDHFGTYPDGAGIVSPRFFFLLPRFMRYNRNEPFKPFLPVLIPKKILKDNREKNSEKNRE